MGIGSIVNLAGSYIESLFTGAPKTSSPTSTVTSATTQGGNQLSTFDQILSSLQQLQQSNPSQYTQVTQQISSSLQTAAQSATAAGNTGLASEVSQLSTDFQKASASGQLPSIQDLAQAIGGGHQHHHHFGGFSTAALAPGTNPAGASSPLSIIENTLSSAGIQVR